MHLCFLVGCIDITSKSLKQLTLCDYLLHIVYNEQIAIPYANNPN